LNIVYYIVGVHQCNVNLQLLDL